MLISDDDDVMARKMRPKIKKVSLKMRPKIKKDFHCSNSLISGSPSF